jgi:succinoglycan biosynthesis transport protein ExoP
VTSQEQSEPGFPFEADIDFRYYASLLWRRRQPILAAALGALALGMLAGEAQTPRYRAATLLQVAPPTPTSLNVTDALVGSGNFLRDRQFFNTQEKVLQSRELAQRVVERLKLDQDPGFGEGVEPAVFFIQHVSLEPIPESLLIAVQVTHADPERAALWANTLAEVYIEDSMEARVESVRRAYEWLQDRLATTQKALRDANERLLQSYEGQDLIVPAGTVSATVTSITRLNDEFVAAQTRRIALEAALKQFNLMRSRGQSLDRVPQVASDGVILGFNQQLAALEVDLSRLLQKYREAHPEVQKVKAQMAQIDRAVEARTTEIEQGLRAEYRQLQGREAELQAALAKANTRAAEQSRKEVSLETLRKEADTASNLYSVLLQKLSETNIAASVQNENVRIIQRAWQPKAPVWPQKGRISGIALLVGLAIGVGFVLLRDYLDNTIGSPEEVERYLRLDVLAAVPRYDKESSHLVAEAYQSLRTSLLFERKGEGGQVVLVVGTAPGEGKTTTVLNIGKLLAVAGEKTLIIDCDLRRANLHHRLELSPEPGFTDIFTRQLEATTLARPTRFKNLYALTAGRLPRNPPGILGRPKLTEVLDSLRGQYRWLLVDTPPLASVTDALLLARHADLSILVIEHNKVDKKVIRRSLDAMRKMTGSVIGAVLNAVDMRTQSPYYSYYYTRELKSQPATRDVKKPGGPKAAA